MVNPVLYINVNSLMGQRVPEIRFRKRLDGSNLHCARP